ncbi:MAG: glycosyltransferase family A protein [Candidatus Omnitrophota bacterium]
MDLSGVRVSLTIQTYNYGRFIGRTIQSLLAQTHTNFELIVSDNASVDDTESVVKSFGDSRIKYYRNATNIEGNQNFRRCLELASSDIVTVYHADDVYEPGIVAAELEMLLHNSDVAVVSTGDWIINEDDEIISKGVDLPPGLAGKNVYAFEELYQDMLKRSGSFLVYPTLMGRRKILLNMHPTEYLDECLDWMGGASDIFLYLKIAEKYKIGVINERLIRRRVHPRQASSLYESSRVTRSEVIQVLDCFLDSPALSKPITPGVLAQYDYNKFWDDVKIATNMIKAGDRKTAVKLLLKSFSLKYLVQGLKSLRNFCKICIYAILLPAAICGLGKPVVAFLDRFFSRFTGRLSL